MLASAILGFAALALAAVGVLPSVNASKRRLDLGFGKEELDVIRSCLTEERIAGWLKDPVVLDVVRIDNGKYRNRVAIVAGSILKALKTIRECAELKSLSTSKTFNCRFRAHLVREVHAVRNLRVEGRMLAQLLVLPLEAAIEPASLADALSLGDVAHKVSEVEGYLDCRPSKKKLKLAALPHVSTFFSLLQFLLSICGAILSVKTEGAFERFAGSTAVACGVGGGLLVSSFSLD